MLSVAVVGAIGTGCAMACGSNDRINTSLSGALDGDGAWSDAATLGGGSTEAGAAGAATTPGTRDAMGVVNCGGLRGVIAAL
jgi:hypothetical protein